MNERIDTLASAYFSGTLTSDELAELKCLLREDKQALKRFCDEADFEQLLREVSIAVPLSKLPQRERIPQRALWTAAALVLLSTVLLSFGVHHFRRAEILAEIRVSPQGLIAISGPAEGKRLKGQLEKGSTLRVVQGSVELRFREGVLCFLEAPAQLTLTRKGLVQLTSGRARFDVEERARGFQVLSGDLALTDLGTTFGVDASQPSPEVHVLSGLVVGQSRSGKREESHVVGGQAMALVEPGEMTPIPIDRLRFRSSLGTGIPALHLSFDQAESSEMVCGGSIASRDEVHLLMDSAYPPQSAPGRFGEALEFDGERTLVLTNWSGISGSKARTISFWIQTTRNGANPILGWGFSPGIDKMSYFGVRLGEQGRLRIVSGRRWLEGGEQLHDGQWHHIVVITGDYQKGAWPVTRLYIDGERSLLTPRVPVEGAVASLDTFDTLTNEVGSCPLMIGRFMRQEEVQPWVLDSFHGLIDEVIVAEGILSEEGVGALFEGLLRESGLDLTSS